MTVPGPALEDATVLIFGTSGRNVLGDEIEPRQGPRTTWWALSLDRAGSLRGSSQREGSAGAGGSP
jgi:hypothetical protein